MGQAEPVHHTPEWGCTTRDLLAGLLGPAVVTDGDGRVLYANSAAMRAFGTRGSVLVGKMIADTTRFGVVTQIGESDGVDPVAYGVMAQTRVTGLPAVGIHVCRDQDNGNRIEFSVETVPVHTELGSIAAMIALYHDMSFEQAAASEREWMRKELLESRLKLELELSRTQVMREVASAAASSLDSEELARRLLATAERLLDARAGAVYLLHGTGRAREIAGFGFASEALPRQSVNLDDSTLPGRAMLTGEVQVAHGEMPPSDTSVRDGVERRLDDRHVAVPIGRFEHRLGALMLSFEQGHLLDDVDFELYEAISDQLSVGFQRTQQFESEHHIAETLQETLVVLPSRVPGVRFSRAYESATYQSGRVGGDFVDIFAVDRRLVALTLGDVSGKGLDAAVSTSLVRTTLRIHALDGLPPAEIVARANRMMHRFTEIESFATLWFGLLHTKSGALHYISAGHPPALVVHCNGAVRELEYGDAVIGAFEEARYSEHRTRLSSGDRLILYSDGLTEARTPDGEFLGERGLQAVVARHAPVPISELATSIMDDVVAFSEGVLRDDAALLAVEPARLRKRVMRRQLA